MTPTVTIVTLLTDRREFLPLLKACINNQNYDNSKNCYPTISDGIEGMKFIEAVLESSKNNSKWTRFNNE